MANDINKTFSSLACIVLFGGLAASTQVGLSAFLIALFMCYVMLSSANAISRGEKRRR